MVEKIEAGRTYNVLAQPLDTATTDKEFQLPGAFLEFATDGTLSGVSVRIGLKVADSIPLNLFKQHRVPAGFAGFFVTWTAQSGKTLWIYTGGEGSEVRRV